MTASDLRAEQSVLGAVLAQPESLTELGYLKADHFSRPAHQILYSTLRQMFAAGDEIDSVTVFARLSKSQEIQRVGGAPYMSDLLKAYKSTENVDAYGRIVVEHWKIRQVNELGHELVNIQADPGEVPAALERVRGFLDGVDQEQESQAVDFGGLYEAWSAANEDSRPCLETPWAALNDRLNGGLQRQRLYVIGARPGCGKTVMGTQIVLHAAHFGFKTMMFSLELSKADLAGRMYSAGAQVPYAEVTSKRLSTDSYGRISKFVGENADMHLMVDDTPDLTIEDIAQRARITKQRVGLDIVLIDYLQLLAESPKSGESRVQRVDHMAKLARNIARTLDVAVVVCAQLNRAIESEARLPTKADFRESGGIEQTADAAIILTRPPAEDGEVDAHIPLMSAVVVKNRQGTEGVVTLRERFDQQRFDG